MILLQESFCLCHREMPRGSHRLGAEVGGYGVGSRAAGRGLQLKVMEVL